MIVKFNRDGKEWTVSSSGRKRFLRLVKRNVENNLCLKASDIAKNIDVSPSKAAIYIHKLGHYGRAAMTKTLLRPANINHA